MSEYLCKHCGQKFTTLIALTSGKCSRHPQGPFMGRHAPYEGSLKTTYVCKYCGQKFSSMIALTSCACHRHPQGPFRGKHEAML